MGREQCALTPHNPLMALAQWLEALRQRSGWCWSQVARAVAELGISVSQATLFRAAQGERLPKWRTVEAFTHACGGDGRTAKRLWEAAARHTESGTSAISHASVLRPEFITEPWELVHAMRQLRREQGNPSLRELESRATVRGGSYLPHSTVSAVLRGRMPGKELLLYYVRYCGRVPEDQLGPWAEAWERVRSRRRGEPAPSLAETRKELRAAEAEVELLRSQLARTSEELSRAHRAAPTGATATRPRDPGVVIARNRLRSGQATPTSHARERGPGPGPTRRAGSRPGTPSSV
ncbi:hypothetical protein E0L36_26950 [Streptomyces sp. AJS327]|uniref:helix-turn-helix domain-containing protein n=1 Tax=Streptomyces sp. AJS327 TaxID=2545265 RepID=UPI0015DF5C61|nr:helix-turn-helix domain-containing protein [Streptomyces sp. AJS327]MBA0054354.1 hypothetical protein [Streptomyces sp. AJS327]